MQDKTRFLYRPTFANEPLESYLTFTRYSCNNRPALQLYCYDTELEGFLPYATLSVNLPDAKPSNSNCIFVDVNNCPFVLHLLITTLNVAKLTNHTASSGWCIYPEVELNPDALSKYI